MTWNNDAHGLVGKSNEIKAYLPGHSWAMKLSQLHKQPDAMVRIATYSLNADMAVENWSGGRVSFALPAIPSFVRKRMS
jgi:hypothetical protein